MTIKKTYCIRGHDIAIAGRTKDGHCKICKKLFKRTSVTAERILPRLNIGGIRRRQAALARHWWTGAEVKEIRRLAHEDELSLSRIASVFNVSRNAIAGVCHREGIRTVGESGAPFGNSNRKRKEKS